MKRLLIALCCVVFQAGSMAAFSEPLAVGATDSMQSVLASQKGKRLSVKLASGEELTGEVAVVNDSVVYLTGLTGREFFDALVNIADIQAVVVRAK